uniref:Uncharacterized protein LOC111120257 n=1 Tax=Crassostrea virginica TaxID=6565 RepID=A0A8B8CLN0_CRAVI|nr:uncharacterized protein LOC111120257 [Crassostrea virginica]
MACIRCNSILKTCSIFLLLIHIGSGEFCSNTYGRTFQNKGSCTQLEHCVSNFNRETGQCPHNQCEPGWMGPGCQYENLVINSINRDKVFDGDMTTHRSINFARVNLNGSYRINALMIHTIGTFSLGDVRIKDHNLNVLPHLDLPQLLPTIYLVRPVTTTLLHLDFVRNIDIKEIEVFGGKNVALWKRTTQTSTYSDDGVYFTSDKAVDGNTDGNFAAKTCTHTAATTGNTWNVDLGGAFTLIAIKIYNRNNNHNLNREELMDFSCMARSEAEHIF